jgi:hypothetical protein
MENQQNNQIQNFPSDKDLQGGEMPNKVIVNSEEKTWEDEPMSAAVREAGQNQGYTQPDPEIQPETEETGNQRPLTNPDEARPQTTEPTIIQQPTAETEEYTDSADLEEDVIEHSERGNLNDMEGYNEPKSNESQFYK